MIDADYLAKVISLARATGLSHLKMAGLELTFTNVSPTRSSIDQAPPLAAPAQPEPFVPPEFKDETMSFDQILNWSGSPDNTQEEQLPLTGDQPLMAP